MKSIYIPLTVMGEYLTTHRFGGPEIAVTKACEITE